MLVLIIIEILDYIIFYCDVMQQHHVSFTEMLATITLLVQKVFTWSSVPLQTQVDILCLSSQKNGISVLNDNHLLFKSICLLPISAFLQSFFTSLYHYQTDYQIVKPVAHHVAVVLCIISSRQVAKRGSHVGAWRWWNAKDLFGQLREQGCCVHLVEEENNIT